MTVIDDDRALALQPCVRWKDCRWRDASTYLPRLGVRELRAAWRQVGDALLSELLGVGWSVDAGVTDPLPAWMISGMRFRLLAREDRLIKRARTESNLESVFDIVTIWTWDPPQQAAGYFVLSCGRRNLKDWIPLRSQYGNHGSR